MKTHHRIFAVAFALLFLPGCTVRELAFNGGYYKHTSFGTRSQIGEMSASASSNAFNVKIKGYANDQVEALGLIAEKAAEGAAKGLTK